MHESPSERVLRREVEPPQRQPTGLGVMLIASAAMFFAVAGSAFVVRARMAGHCCDRAHLATHAHVQAVVVPDPTDAPAPSIRWPLTSGAEPCGQAVYRAGENGKTMVDFHLCPPRAGEVRAVEPPVPILITEN